MPCLLFTAVKGLFLLAESENSTHNHFGEAVSSTHIARKGFLTIGDVNGCVNPTCCIKWLH